MNGILNLISLMNKVEIVVVGVVIRKDIDVLFKIMF